jgi:hypothetical protein
MRASKTHAFGVLLVLATHASPASAQRNWPYTPRGQAVAIPPNVGGEFVASIVGLPLLTEQKLPSGYREYRFEVECGMCLPTYLIRLRLSPNGRASGEAYLLWFAHDSTLAGDTSARARGINTAPNNCAAPLRGPATGRDNRGDYTWCPARLSKNLSWPSLVKALDSLGVLNLPTANGYAPDPPNFGVDTVKWGDRLVHWPRRDCRDLGSPSLEMSALIAGEYRAASFWCLESKAPGKPEHFRVAKAYELLHGAVERYRDIRDHDTTAAQVDKATAGTSVAQMPVTIVMKGRVVDRADGVPLFGVTVTLDSVGSGVPFAVTDSTGWFVLRVTLPLGHQTLRTNNGFYQPRAETIAIAARGTMDVGTLRLERGPEPTERMVLPSCDRLKRRPTRLRQGTWLQDAPDSAGRRTWLLCDGLLREPRVAPHRGVGGPANREDG